MPTPSAATFLGIGKETTKGAAVAPTAYIPITQFTPQDTVIYLPDNGMRGAAVDSYGEVAGDISSTIGIAGDVFPDSVGYLVGGITGDVVTTGASAPFSHAAAVKNSGDMQPVSWSITDHYGLSGGTPDRRYAGCQVSDLSLKWNADGLFGHTATLVGFPSTLVAKPTQSFTTLPPVPTWAFTATIGGTAKTFVESAELNLKRTTAPIFTMSGAQTPYAVWVSSLAADGKMTIVVEDETEIARYLTGASTSVVFDMTTGAGAALVEFKVQMSKVQYTLTTYKRDKSYLAADITFKALGNTTDVGASGGYSQVKFTMQNALPSGSYQ